MVTGEIGIPGLRVQQRVDWEQGQENELVHPHFTGVTIAMETIVKRNNVPIIMMTSNHVQVSSTELMTSYKSNIIRHPTFCSVSYSSKGLPVEGATSDGGTKVCKFGLAGNFSSFLKTLQEKRCGNCFWQNDGRIKKNEEWKSDGS